MLTGKRVHLRLLEKGDLEKRVEWINDEDNIRTLLFDWPTSLAKTEAWFAKVVTDPTRVHFSFIDNQTNCLIGMTGMLNIDQKNQNAQIYLTIGDKSRRGERLPAEVHSMTLTYAFSELNLVKVYAYTLPANESARRIFTALGFTLDGVLRQHVYCRGIQQDLYVQSILREEWKQREINIPESESA
jgi:diamine N-acetyltransferase